MISLSTLLQLHSREKRPESFNIFVGCVVEA